MPPELEIIQAHGERCISTTHHITGRIGKLATREWSMKIKENYSVKDATQESGVINTYQFVWSDQITKVAKKVSKIAYTDRLELIDIVENAIDNGIDIVPELWQAQIEYEHVTADDCNILIKEADTLFTRTRLRQQSLEMDYSY